GRLPDEVPLSTALAAWLVDRHADRKEDWLDIADRWADALVISNEERSALLRCLEIYRTLETTWDRLGVAKQKRLAARPDFEQSLLLMQATDRQGFVDVRRRVLELAKTGLSPQPLLDGNDLIELGLQPGPIFSRVLDAVYDAQLEGAI